MSERSPLHERRAQDACGFSRTTRERRPGGQTEKVVGQKGTESPGQGQDERGAGTVEITCPNCNFSKRIRREEIPVGVKWATCPRCKHRFEFALPSTGGEPHQGPEGRPPRSVAPWESRAEIGLWQSMYQTFKAVLFSPEDLFAHLSCRSGIREPLAFGLLFGSLGIMFTLFWQILFLSGPILPFDLGLADEMVFVFLFVVVAVFVPLFVTITIFVSSGILHVLLLCVRGGQNGFEATFRVIAYSQATQILGLIPFIGGVAGSIWLLVIQFIGVREMHETSYLKVILAFLIPFALIFLLVIFALMAIFVFDVFAEGLVVPIDTSVWSGMRG